MDRDQFDAFNSLMAQEAESGDYDDLIEMAEGGPVGEDMENDMDTAIKYYAQGGRVIPRVGRAAQMLQKFADGGDVRIAAQQAPVDRLFGGTQPAVGPVAMPVAVFGPKGEFFGSPQAAVAAGVKDYTYTPSLNIPTFNPTYKAPTGPIISPTSVTTGTSTVAPITDLGKAAALRLPTTSAPAATAKALFDQITPSSLAGAGKDFSAAETSTYTPTALTTTKPTLLTAAQMQEKQPELMLYEPSLKYGGIKVYKGPLQTSPYQDLLTPTEPEVKPPTTPVPKTPKGYIYTPYVSLTPEQLLKTGTKAQITDMFKGIVAQQEKDVNSVRAEFNQALIDGNWTLANTLKDILVTQEAELGLAKADLGAVGTKYKTAFRAAGSPPEGEISDPVQRLIAQQSRTKDQGMDSTARAMLKKFAGGGEAKALAAPEEEDDRIPDMPPNPTDEDIAEFRRKLKRLDDRSYWKRQGPNSADERVSGDIEDLNLYYSMPMYTTEEMRGYSMPMQDDVEEMRAKKEARYYRHGGPVQFGKGGAVKKAAEALKTFLEPSKIKQRLYHGTTGDIYEFDPATAAKQTGNPTSYFGTFLSDSPKEAGRYARDWQHGGTYGGNIMPVHAQIKNPYPMSYKEYEHYSEAEYNRFIKNPSKEMQDKHRQEAMQEVLARKQQLIDQGYDGIVVKIGGINEYIPFSPNQIKSATGNRGTYDITDPDIRKAKGGLVHRADGSPVYGEIATGDSGITADTLTGLRSRKGVDGFASEAAKMLRNLVGEGVSNLESGLRGSVAAIPGTFGDIESIFRESDKTRKLATTEEVLRDYMPKRLTKPTKEAAGFEEVGTYLPLPVPAGTATKVAKGVKSGAKKALEELGPTAAGMAEKQLQKVGLGPMQVVPEGPSASLPLTMTERTEQGRLFRGRLDDLIAEIRNPVTKGQFLGSLRGKAREYEISRAAQALQDLDDAAKITPAELSSRIDKLATPSRYRTTFIEPKDSGLHNKYDNVYGAADHPVGVINLSYVPTHEAIRAEEAGNKVRASISSLGYRAEIGELLGNLEDFVKTSSALVKNPEKQKDLLSGLNNLRSDLSQSQEKDKLLNELTSLRILDFPEYKGSYGELLTEKMRQAPPEIVASRGKDPSAYSNFYEKSSEEVLAELRLKALQRINAQHPLLKQYLSEPEYLDLLSNAKDSPVRGENKLDALRNRLASDIKAERGIALADNNEVIQRLLAEADKSATYKGSHAAVNPEKNAMGFSRFTEHTVNVPGMGKLDGIYVSELQSDMFRDIKKMGKLGGSRDADTKEIQALVNGIKTKLASVGDKLDKSYGGTDAFLFTVSDIKNPDALSSVLQGPYIGMPASKANSIAADIIKDGKRIEKLKERAGILTNEPKGTYQIEEPIANIETQPQVVQQLLAKNAIAGAIQRGKSFVAFPGVESKQAKLYEKLPNNLKQVIKDLGEGFVMQPITIKAKDGVERTHLAVIWDNNAAQRIMNQGVPFKKGGLVDKNNANNRKYI